MELGIVSTLPLGAPVRRISYSTLSPECLGVQFAAIAASAAASAVWAVANGAIYVPITLVDAGIITNFFIYNGAANSGNTDIGLYTDIGTASSVKLISAGSTAGAGTNALQTFNTTDTYVPAGRYYLAAAIDNTTAEVFTSVATNAHLKAWGVATQTSAFALPATATMVTAATWTGVPIMGFTYRSFV